MLTPQSPVRLFPWGLLMKSTALLLLPLLGASLLAAEDGSAADRKKLQGKWAVVSHQASGKKTPAKKLVTLVLTVAGDEFTSRDGAEVLDESTFKLGASARP